MECTNSRRQKVIDNSVRRAGLSRIKPSIGRIAMAQRITLNVNGNTHTVDVDPDMPLLYALRDDVGLRNPKFGCGLAQCGACTVHVNGEATRSCVTPVSAVDGA